MSNELALFDEKRLEALSKDEVQELIMAVEAMALEQTDLHVEVPPKHIFSKGIYAREIFVPKGTLLIGKMHKHPNLNIVSKGEMTVLSIDGLKRIKAPATFVSSPGVKRMGYAHEDTVWTTIHGTDETDLDKIEDEFIYKKHEEFELLNKKSSTEIEGD